MSKAKLSDDTGNTLLKSSLWYIILLLLLLTSVNLFCGVYKDDEFGQKLFFVKHTASWKFYFHAPRGLSDDTSELSKDQKLEQVRYDEFVPKRKWEFPISF